MNRKIITDRNEIQEILWGLSGPGDKRALVVVGTTNPEVDVFHFGRIQDNGVHKWKLTLLTRTTPNNTSGSGVMFSSNAVDSIVLSQEDDPIVVLRGSSAASEGDTFGWRGR